MKNKVDLLKLDTQLCFQLYLASKSLTKVYQPLLEPLDITYPQYLALLVLWERDEISVKELGEKLHLDSGTLSPLLKRLQSKKLISKERDAQDERSVVVRLTAGGRALKSKAQCIPPDLLKSMQMSEADLKALFYALKALNLNLEDE